MLIKYKKTLLPVKDRKQKNLINSNNQFESGNKIENNDYMIPIWNYLGNTKPPFNKIAFYFKSTAK